MAENSDPQYIDKRTSDRKLRAGLLEEKVLERHLKGLPDVADKAVPVETTMDLTDDFDDDEDDELDELDEGAARA